MTINLKPKDVHFRRQFQESVLSKMVDTKGKRLIDPESMGDTYFETGNEDREVKMDLRFLNKSTHNPIVHFNLQNFTPNSEDIKNKSARIRFSSLPSIHKGNRNPPKAAAATTSQGEASKDSKDSVLHGVFIALDYDEKTLNRIHHKKQK